MDQSNTIKTTDASKNDPLASANNKNLSSDAKPLLPRFSVARGLNSKIKEQDESQNWAKDFLFSSSQIQKPKSLEELQTIIAQASSIKAFGTRHSFSKAADTTGTRLSLAHFDSIEIDLENQQVKVGAGVRYGELCKVLNRAGFAVSNLASLPHISVVGACTTATHGSGNQNGTLASAVSAMEIVSANGNLKEISKTNNPELFNACVVSIGALGAISNITLDIVPSFQIRQNVFERLPLALAVKNFEDISSAAYSVSLFTSWKDDYVDQVWLKQQVDRGRSFAQTSKFFEATAALHDLHPLSSQSSKNCTKQMGFPGPSYRRLPHFRLGFKPSSGDELQSEYFVPRSAAGDAFLEINKIRDSISPLLLISEIRTVAADSFWLSPCYKQDSVGIHFTWKKDKEKVLDLLPKIEEVLAPFNTRPHWAKLFCIAPKELEARYPKLSDFRDLTQEWDPTGKFHNEFLKSNRLVPVSKNQK